MSAPAVIDAIEARAQTLANEAPPLSADQVRRVAAVFDLPPPQDVKQPA